MHQLNLHPLSGNFVSAKPLGVRDGTDYQFTGEVRSIYQPSIEAALETGAAILMNTLGYSSTGEVFNLALSDILTAVAKSLDVEKVICFSTREALTAEYQHKVIKPTKASLPAFINDDAANMLQAVAKTVRAGVPRAHVLSYEDDGALLKELFTHDGSGLLISEDEFLTVRDAQLADVPGILELIQPLQESGALVVRTREVLEGEINHFSVVDIDDTVAGCGALIALQGDLCEIACIAIHPTFQGRGFASNLLNELEAKAVDQGMSGIYILSTQTTHWFAERGYQEASAEQLPEQRRTLYNSERNSKVMYKALT